MKENTGNTPYRAGVIGMGKMGLVHASTIRSHPRVTVAAFCETSKFMVQALKSFFPDVDFYSDYEEMLAKAELDVVYITTPTGLHASIAGACADAGKHFFVEKPLATNLEEALSVVENVKKSMVKTQVGYVCRYSPTFEKAKEILDSGVIGRVLGFNAVKYSSDVLRRVEKSWRFMRKASEGGGGVVNEFACHGIDLVVWYFGEPRSVDARMESWYSSDVEDYVHAVMDYGEYTGWVDSSWSMQDFRKPYTRIEVTGDNGRLIVTDSEVRWLIARSHAGAEAGWYQTNITELYEPVRVFIGDIMFSRQADAFISSLDGGTNARSEIFEALRTQRVLQAIHEGEKR